MRVAQRATSASMSNHGSTHDVCDRWEYNRNGWCPGAISIGNRVDITRDVQAGENTLDFNILLANGIEYDNTSPVELLPYTLVSLKLYVWY